MTCTQCQTAGVNLFSKRQADKKRKRYQEAGPDKTTRLLLDALIGEGVEGQTLLDIGGGIGVIALELFKQGVTTATEIEASPAYVAVARDTAEQQGMADRVACQEGDFVALAPSIASAGIVTLDRVICCYPDMLALVGQSAAKAGKLYGAVYPRDTWWVRAIRTAANRVLPLLRIPQHLYIHRSAEVDAVIQGCGLAPRFHHDAGYWQVVVYARPA